MRGDSVLAGRDEGKKMKGMGNFFHDHKSGDSKQT